jgi:hypothetical protein
VQLTIDRRIQLFHLFKVIKALPRLLTREQQFGPFKVGIGELLIEVDADVEVVERLLLVVERPIYLQAYSWAIAR